VGNVGRVITVAELLALVGALRTRYNLDDVPVWVGDEGGALRVRLGMRGGQKVALVITAVAPEHEKKAAPEGAAACGRCCSGCAR
jgi:hypothetical protein